MKSSTITVKKITTVSNSVTNSAKDRATLGFEIQVFSGPVEKKIAES